VNQIDVLQWRAGYVLRIPISMLPQSLPRYIQLTCNDKVVKARLLKYVVNYAYYRVYARYVQTLLELSELLKDGGVCVVEYYDYDHDQIHKTYTNSLYLNT